MFKKIIALTLTAAMLTGMGVSVSAETEVEAEKENKLYCLSDNTWREKHDYEIYSEKGIELENYKTGAEYSYVGETDLYVLEQDGEECTKLTNGNIGVLSTEDGIWGAFNDGEYWRNRDYVYILFDLKDTYWVSKADIWSIAWNNVGIDTMEVSVGEDPDEMKTLPKVKVTQPTASEIQAANNRCQVYTTVEFDAVKARYVKIATKRAGAQQTFTEAAVFGYLEKPSSGNEVIDDYVEETPEVLAEEKSPRFNEYGAYTIDLGEIKRVTSIDVTEYRSKVSGLEEYEVWLSSDGYSYAKNGVALAKDKVTIGDIDISIALDQKPYARYVKLVGKEDENKDGFNIRSIKVNGTAGTQQERIDGNATYSYWDIQPYQTNIDIMAADPEKTLLMDGDTEKCISTAEKWATVVVNLGGQYQIGDIDIYSLANNECFLEGAEIRYSLDGSKWFTYTYYVNTNEKTGGIVKSSFSGQPGRNARYLKLIMQSNEHKLAISEIAVSGYKVEEPRMSETPKVPLRVEMKNYLLAYLDWSTFNEDNASKFNVYIEKTPFTNTKQLTPKLVFERYDDEFKNKYATYQPLEPETIYYFAITAFDDYGVENTSVTPVVIKTEKVLGDEVGETFNITLHPTMSKNPFGSYDATYRVEALRLYDELGVSNKTSGWSISGTDKFAEIGVSCNQLGYISGVIDKGSYLFGSGNESDLSAVPPEKFVAGQISTYSRYQAEDPRTVISLARMGGVDDKSINWLRSVYAYDPVGVKEHSHVLDVHLYPKNGYEQIPGLPESAPEQLPWMMARVRGVLEEFNDADKPIICSEAGYNTSDSPGTQGITTQDDVAMYLPRLYLLMISEGVRESWWYAFWDEGVDATNGEHMFAMVDYFGVPKKHYYSMNNIFYQLRYSDYLGAVPGLSHPYYGFSFYDEAKSKVISTAWAADAKEQTMTFETLSGEDELVEIITYDGGFKTVQTRNGEGSVLIGGGPVYIYSKSGIKATQTARAFNIVDFAKVATKGEEVTFTITRDSLGKGVSGNVSAVSLPSGWSIVNDTSFTAEQEAIDVKVKISNTSKENNQNLTLRVNMDDGRVENLNASVEVQPYMSVEFVPEPVTFGDWTKWRIAATCTNTATIPISGRLVKSSSSGIIISTQEAQYIDTLKPGEAQTVYFDIEELPEIGSDAVATFVLDVNGERRNIERPLNFTACVNDGITPVIDGKKSEGEYDNCQVIHLESDDKADLSYDVYRKWDDTNFYLLVDALDDVFYNPYSGQEIWGADGIQFCLDFKREEGVGASSTLEYFELGLAAQQDTMKPLTWAWFADMVIKQQKEMTGYECVITRDEDTKHTVYEIAIPWSYLKEVGTIADHKIIGFDICMNDGDGAGTGRQHTDYRGGIAGTKDTNLFEDMVLVKK